MKRLVSVVLLFLLLVGCSPSETTASSTSSEESSQVEQSTPVGLADQSRAEEPILLHEEAFYADHALGFDHHYLPNYGDPADIAETDKFKFFEYFVFADELYDAGEQFYNTETSCFEIPIAEIETVLDRYLGISFDPAVAFENQAYDAEFHYGYDAENALYVTPTFGRYVSSDYMALSTGRTTNEDGSVTITFACYYLPEDNLQYKVKTMTFLEDPDDLDHYQILQNVDTYTIDGQSVTVTTAEEYSQLRSYLEKEPWFR